MASFTDELIQYNPYVAQLPVEAYVNTGMALQGRYDQNVQRISTIVDQVGNLPVAGDANKQYLAQRMSELRSKMQGVGAADFSKNNLVTQIQGMASQLTKDPTIQAGMLSAQKIQQLQTHIEDVRKNKPEFYSDANAERALADVQTYMEQSQKVAGLTYAGPTSMTVGTESQVKEKMMKAIKELHPETEVNWNENGQLVFKNQDEVLTPERVMTIAQSVLTADDQRILSNAAWYNFRGMSDKEVMQATSDYYAGNEKYYKTQADDMRKYIETTDGLTPEQKAMYNNKAKYFDAYAKKHGENKTNIETGYKKGMYNRDQITGAFWQNKTLDGFGAMAYRNRKESDIKVNPNLEVQKLLLDMEKTKADIEKTRKETGLLGKPKPGDTPEGPAITPTAMNITVDDVNGRFKDMKDNDVVQEQIKNKDNEAVNAYTDALKSYHSVETSNGDVIIDEDKLDRNGNLTKEAQKEATDALIEMDQNYKDVAFTDEGLDITSLPKDDKGNPIVPERKVIAGYNEKALRKWRDFLAVNNARNQMMGLDKQVEKEAIDKLKLKGDYKEPTDKLEVNGKTYTYNQLKAIYNQGAEKTVARKGPNGEWAKGVDTVPASYEDKDMTSVKAKKGSELEKLGIGTVYSAISKAGGDQSKILNKAKDEIYRGKGTVRQPLMTFAVTSEKDSKLSNNKTLQTAFTESLPNGFLVGEEGKAADYAGKIDPEKVFIKGAYWDRGKLYMRASANLKTEDGKEAATKTFDVDITQIREKYPQNGDWFDQTFVQDKYAPLTESLLAPGASGKTPLDPKDGFANSLMVVANNHTPRYYSIKRTSGNKFVVQIAIPMGNGQFSMKSYLNTATGDVDQFNNAGQAIQAVDMFYKNPNALIIEKNLIGNGK